MYNIVIMLVAVFINTSTSDRTLDRSKVDVVKTQYASLTECRVALQHSQDTQGAMASSVEKLNKWVDGLTPPAGTEFFAKKVKALCLPADVDEKILRSMAHD